MKSPFKFLDSYTREDREIFFGREQEINELYRRVFESKILLVYGISGTGKSSLVHCGLANKIQESDWLPINVRRGSDIVSSMASAIQNSCLSPLNEAPSTAIQFKKGVRSLYLDYYKPIFFIFDQFEELFIFGSKEEQKSLVHVIKSLVDSELQCRFIFVMREEYLAGVTELEKTIPNFLANRVRIEHMSFSNAKDAIIGPCKVDNIELEEGFADSLLERLSPESSDVELTYLQVFLDKIYHLAQEENGGVPSAEADGNDDSFSDENIPLAEANENNKNGNALKFTKNLLQRTGNVSDLLGSFLDEQITQLSDPDSALAVLKSFVSVKGTKRQMSPEEVQEYTMTLGKPLDAEPLRQLIQTFIHLRILRDKDQNGRYELLHDALAEKIYEKITLVEKELLEIRQLIENDYNNWQKRGVLLSKDDLQYIAPYESRLYIPSEYVSLIDKSKKALVQARQRRRNLITAGTIILILVLGGFTFWAIKERILAVQKEKIANEAKIQAKASEQSALEARDNAIESNKNAVEARNKAEESELRTKHEKEIAEIRERQARANNFNFLSKEMVNQDPTVALRLAQYALSLDTNNTAIINNLNRIYYDNNFYKILFRDNESKPSQISPDWTKIISIKGRTAKLSYLNGNDVLLFMGHIASGINSDLNIHQLIGNHYDDIFSIAFSPDGHFILTGSADKTARLWDLKGNCLQIFKGHISVVRSVAFSPDGKTVLTGSSDQTARLWDMHGNTLQIFRGHKSEIFSVAFSPNGKLILTGSGDSTARIWDMNGKSLQVLKGHTAFVNKVAFSPDGNSVLTGSWDNTVHLWDLQGNTLQIFRGHLDYISALSFSPDGKTILTASRDKTARLWDLQGNSLQVFSGHSDVIYSLAFSPVGNRILTFSNDGTCRIWDIAQNEVRRLTGHKDAIITAEFSHDGQSIITSSADKTVRVWDISGNILHIFPIFTGSVAFSPDGRTILSGLMAAQTWDLSGKSLQIFTGHKNIINSAKYSPDGKTILTGSIDKTARLWDLNGNILQVFNGHTSDINSVAFSPKGNTILTGSADKTAMLWDLHGNILKIYFGHASDVNSVAFSPDGKTILTGSADKTARLWDLKGNTLQIFSGHSKAINSVAFSPDGNTVLTGSDDKTVRLFNLKGNSLQIWTGFRDKVNSAVFSPDGKTILIASGDNSARLFNVKMPLKSFLKENSLEELSTEQQLHNGLIHINDIIQEKDENKLFEGLNFCLSEAKLQSNKRAEYINEASILYKKLWSSFTNTASRIDYVSCGLDLFRLLPQKYISDRIEKANKLFLASNTIEALKEAFEFYSDKCSDLDSLKIAMKLPETFIQISKKLLSSDTSSRYIISTDLSCLSWLLLQNKKFIPALEAINLAIKADSTNPYIYTCLPTILVLNDRFSEAREIYLKYKNVFIFNNIFMPNRQIFRDDILDLESRGIRHPDFAKVKELLKK
jgi:WD40 repeat protein